VPRNPDACQILSTGQRAPRRFGHAW
jgi:hypothetical protein